MTDKINHPGHYTEYPIEVIDIIKIVLTKAYGEKAFEAYCWGNEIKYRMRAGLKGESTDEDIKKASKYKEFREGSFNKTAKELKQEVFDCLDRFLEKNKHDLEQVNKDIDENCFAENKQPPDNEEWENSGDVIKFDALNERGRAKKCGQCYGFGKTFIPESESWITCRVCDGVGYV